MHIKLEQRLKESMFLPLNCRLVSKEKGNLILNHARTRFNIHGVPPFFVQLHCQSALLKALCEATKSGLQLLSTSVLPFPSSLLSLSLSLVITVKVQLQCLPWELSQRCVTAMWCFTRWVTKPPVVIHTCGISKSSPHMRARTHTHTTIWSYHLLPVDTLPLPQVHFYLTRHRRNQLKFSFFLAIQEQFWQVQGKRNTVLQLHWIASVCSYLVKTLLLANDCLASLLIASCSRSFVISCRLWHFHMLTLCYF